MVIEIPRRDIPTCSATAQAVSLNSIFPPPMPPHVVIRHLSKRYGAVEAVRGVGLEIARGEVFGLLGPNGAGKTTTLECLVGLREADAGELTVGGIDMRRQPREAKQRIGVALQSPALPGRITPREALRLLGKFYRDRIASGALLERFNLVAQADTVFERLSGGQQQRLALAVAFVNRPELVVLDEPTSGLDPQSRREILAEIARLKADGHTVLLSTHQLDEAEQACDRLAIIDHGRIVATGSPRELVARAAAKQSVTLMTSRPLQPEHAMRIAGEETVMLNGETARWQTADAIATTAAIAGLLTEQRIEMVDLQIRKASLESVFLDLTRRAEAEQPGGKQ